MTGSLSTVDHAEKVRGFKEFLKSNSAAMRVASVVEARDDPEQALRLTTECLKKNPQIQAIYVSTSNSIPVIQAIEKEGRTGQTAVITTDLFPALIPFIRSGKVWHPSINGPGRRAGWRFRRFMNSWRRGHALPCATGCHRTSYWQAIWICFWRCCLVILGKL